MNVGLPNTLLVIRQDSAFLADASQQKMASNQIQNSNNLVISELNKKLEQYTFETENTYKEASAIIPEQREDIFRNWLKAKLKVDTVEIFRKNN